jgi:hypothetical protein
LERFEHPVGRGLDEAQSAPFSAPVFLLVLPVISAQVRGCCAVACNVVKHALLVEASRAFSRPNIGGAQVGLRCEGRLLGPSLSVEGMMRARVGTGGTDGETQTQTNGTSLTMAHVSILV